MKNDMMWINSCVICLFFLNIDVVVFAATKDCSPSPDVPCTRHSFSNLACSEPELLTEFGHIYLTYNSTFPGTPGSLKATAAWKEFRTNNFFPQVNLTFTPPQDAAVHFVRGFEIVRYEINKPDRVSCYIYDLSNVTWGMHNIKAEFFTSLFPQPKTGPLVYELYALPKYGNRGEDFDQYRQIYIELPKYSDSDKAKDWQGALYLAFSNKTGVVNVTVGNPPTQFNLTHLKYMLVKNGNGNEIVQQGISDQSFYSFKDVKTGEYQIYVQPVDPYAADQDHERCICREDESCTPCSTTKTQSFNFTYTGPKITTGVTTTPTTTPIVTTKPIVAPHRGNEDSMNAVTIAVSVIGGIVGLLIVGVVVYLIYNHKCKTDEKDITHIGNEWKDGGEDETKEKYNNGFHDDGVSIITATTTAPKVEDFEKRPKLFLLYEYDHQYHKKVVETFAKYLQEYCQCTVMCAEWHLDAAWVHQDLHQADNVIIVNSEGAYKSYMSVYGKRKFPDLDHSPPGSRKMSSINSIKNMFQEEQKYDKIVMVYFDYTNEHYVLPDICPGYKYKLMQHFTDFLLHIHQLHRADNLSKYDLPLDGNHKQRETGQQLLLSIAEAAKFEQENPHWSVKRFDRMYSSTSDDSRHDSGVQGDMGSPGQTPVYEKCESWPSPQQANLLAYLEGCSTDAITINPSEINVEIHKENQRMPNGVVKSRPNLNFINKTPHVYESLQHDTEESGYSEPPIMSPDEFEPPDDFENFDVISKTLSEQMQSICDNYKKQTSLENAGQGENGVPSQTQSGVYDRNSDLYFLRVQSGDISFITCTNDDVISLGGESV